MHSSFETNILIADTSVSSRKISKRSAKILSESALLIMVELP
jgi:hypothetical protein